MSSVEMIEEYLAKAQEAESHALRCRDPELKDSWIKMAISYRDMAQHLLDGKSPPTPAPQPSPLPASQAIKNDGDQNSAERQALSGDKFATDNI